MPGRGSGARCARPAKRPAPFPRREQQGNAAQVTETRIAEGDHARIGKPRGAKVIEDVPAEFMEAQHARARIDGVAVVDGREVMDQCAAGVEARSRPGLVSVLQEGGAEKHRATAREHAMTFHEGVAEIQNVLEHVEGQDRIHRPGREGQ